jgi:hypothetical protein
LPSPRLWWRSTRLPKALLASLRCMPRRYGNRQCVRSRRKFSHRLRRCAGHNRRQRRGRYQCRRRRGIYLPRRR